LSELLQSWRALALGAPRAFGEPPAQGQLRAQPEDFVVEEDLGFAPDGDGAHMLLKVRKRNANTGWVAQELARALGCAPRDVGYAGLKDRRAIAVQWFSLPATPRALRDVAAVRHAEFEVLETHRHRRKLPRGALAGNAFNVRIRQFRGSAPQLRERCELISRQGVPNYFGPQRFGREARNLAQLAAADPALQRGRPDGFMLSAARSLIFNAVAGARVQQGTWAELIAGDWANLDGRGSVFAVPEVTPDLSARLGLLEVHPTGPMWGAGEPPVHGEVLELERHTALPLEIACRWCTAAGLRQERRSLRLRVRDLSFEQDGEGVCLRFWLRSGSFATAVLREILADAANCGGEVLDADDA
jgi:tRNA pseudouridine13 synthase